MPDGSRYPGFGGGWPQPKKPKSHTALAVVGGAAIATFAASMAGPMTGLVFRAFSPLRHLISEKAYRVDDDMPLVSNSRTAPGFDYFSGMRQAFQKLATSGPQQQVQSQLDDAVELAETSVNQAERQYRLIAYKDGNTTEFGDGAADGQNPLSRNVEMRITTAADRYVRTVSELSEQIRNQAPLISGICPDGNDHLPADDPEPAMVNVSMAEQVGQAYQSVKNEGHVVECRAELAAIRVNDYHVYESRWFNQNVNAYGKYAQAVADAAQDFVDATFLATGIKASRFISKAEQAKLRQQAITAADLETQGLATGIARDALLMDEMTIEAVSEAMTQDALAARRKYQLRDIPSNQQPEVAVITTALDSAASRLLAQSLQLQGKIVSYQDPECDYKAQNSWRFVPSSQDSSQFSREESSRWMLEDSVDAVKTAARYATCTAGSFSRNAYANPVIYRNSAFVSDSQRVHAFAGTLQGIGSKLHRDLAEARP